MLPTLRKGEAGPMITNNTKWLLAGLLCLALWPGASHGQSSTLMDAYNRFSELYAQAFIQRGVWLYARFNLRLRDVEELMAEWDVAMS